MYKTIEQINDEYDGQWVFMIDCTKDEYHSISGGVVVLNSESRDVVYRKMNQYFNHPSLTSVRYAGRIPEGVYLI